jgi:hypothetical protein
MLQLLSHPQLHGLPQPLPVGLGGSRQNFPAFLERGAHILVEQFTSQAVSHIVCLGRTIC